MSMPRKVGKIPEEKSEARENLARNLKLLLDREPHVSVAEVARRSGVAERTVYNMLRNSNEAGITNVYKVAKVFNLTAWQLLLPQVDTALYDLLSAYNHATPEGKRTIHIAVQTALRLSQEGADGQAKLKS